jgi:glyoxylase-like metal-dependent hydrolase (beta-lactamase superfamily II)
VTVTQNFGELGILFNRHSLVSSSYQSPSPIRNHQSPISNPQFPTPSALIPRFQLRYWAGPAHSVDRVLREGDEVGGFTVIEPPGHAPGHISFWRESDRTLVLGDVLFTILRTVFR